MSECAGSYTVPWTQKCHFFYYPFCCFFLSLSTSYIFTFFRKMSFFFLGLLNDRRDPHPVSLFPDCEQCRYWALLPPAQPLCHHATSARHPWSGGVSGLSPSLRSTGQPRTLLFSSDPTKTTSWQSIIFFLLWDDERFLCEVFPQPFFQNGSKRK